MNKSLLVTLASLFWYTTVYAAAVDKLRATTVHIPNGSGAVVYGKSGAKYILTNWHVCVGIRWKGKLYASYENGQLLHGEITRTDPRVDLCAARVYGDVEALKLAPKSLRKQRIYTRGYPHHILTEDSGQLTGPYVSWKAYFDIAEVGTCPSGFTPEHTPSGVIAVCSITYNSVLSNLYSRPGSSGSPVVDTNGDIMGVISSLHSDNEYEAGLVQYNDLKAFLSAL